MTGYRKQASHLDTGRDGVTPTVGEREVRGVTCYADVTHVSSIVVPSSLP